MKDPLTKSDIAWLLVKLLGIYLLYVGIVGFITVLIVRSNLQDTLDGLSDRARDKASSSGLGLGWLPVLSIAAGSYLVMSGRLIHGLLMSVPFGEGIPDNPRDKMKVGMDEYEVEQFDSWLEQNLEMRERSLVDAVALFRDAQKGKDV